MKTSKTKYRQADLKKFEVTEQMAIYGVPEGHAQDDEEVDGRIPWVLRAPRGSLRVVVLVPSHLDGLIDRLAGKVLRLFIKDGHWGVMGITKLPKEVIALHEDSDLYRQWNSPRKIVGT